MALACAVALPGCMEGGRSEKAPAPTVQPLAAFGREAAPSQPPSKPARVIVKLQAGIDQGLSGASASPSGAISASQATAASASAGRLLGRHRVRSAAPLFAARQRMKRAGVTEAQLDARTRQRFAARAARAPSNAVLPDLGGYYVLDLGPKTPAEVQAALAALRADPEVLSAQEDRVVKVAFAPNDPSYSSLWGMPKIRAGTAWDTARGTGVTVAVIDTGVDYDHPDLNDNIRLNAGEIPANGVDDDGNGLVDDVRGWDFVGQSYVNPSPDNDPRDPYGHGTHVAGTIAAEGNNGLGVIGVAWQAKVMALRALDDSGFGTESTLAPAIIYAADEGADVINASWGATGRSSIIEAAIDHAHGLGAIFVAAAGNLSQDVSTFYPANAPRALVAGAMGEDDGPAYFTNTGKLDVTAPGMNILSTFPGGGYVAQQGTSMAAPHVSGVAALVVQLHPTYSAEQIRQVLRTSAADLYATGFDRWSGYGRVDAASAVAATQAPLEAKFFSPREGLAVNAPTPLVGVARGPGFVRYVVEIASQQSPDTFTQLFSSTSPVNNGTLATWNPSSLTDGAYTLRLRVFHTSGVVYQDRLQVEVGYAQITSPASSPLPALTDVIKAGSAIAIQGRATGGSFVSYNLQWAPGRDATSGFSSSGITLAVPGGTAPVDGGILGTWTTPGTVGEYTVKLTVVNQGFSSTRLATIYVEPDLVSNGWPQYVASGGGGSPILPARMPDGRTRLISCGYSSPDGSTCRSHTTDGSSFTSVALSFGNPHGPAVGRLDDQPGDEVVIADRKRLRILSASLAPIREIVTEREESFLMHRTFLADLDADGIMEIIAIARDTQPGEENWFFYSGSIHVYRADGTPYSPAYPRRLSSPRMPNGIREIEALAVDLDGDGRQEVVVSFQDRDSTLYDVMALRADGSAHPWPTVTFSGQIGYLHAADLDRDGHPELIWHEFAGGQGRIRVVNHDGTTRPGWPVARDGGFAIGDINRDGQEEIVVVSGPNITALKPDGTILPVAWPSLLYSSSVVLADVDDDSFPDLVFNTGNVQGSSAGSWFDNRLIAVSHTGAIIKQWRFFGAQGQQSLVLTPSVADFTGDGKTDLAVKASLVEGGTMNGVLRNGQLTLLTNHTRFNPANAHWAFPARDPQQSRSRLRAPGPPIDEPPTIATGPGASPSPVTGTTSSLWVTAADDHGEEALTYTWSVVGTPPAPVDFSVNGTNEAKTSVATFSAPGTYDLRVIIQDASHQQAVGEVTVTVAQTLSAIVVTPPTATVPPGGIQRFSAVATDQFGATLIDPAFTWRVSGGGMIATNGLFVAGHAVGGPFTVTASSGGISGTAQVSVAGGGTFILEAAADAHVRDGASAGANFGTAMTLETKNTATTGNVRRLFVRFPLEGVGIVTAAKLRLNGNSVTSAKLIGVHAVANVPWGESTITFNNAPAIGAKQGASVSVAVAPARYYDWDVTSYLQAQRAAGATAVTFEVKQNVATGESPSVFTSRHAPSNRPQLVVTTSGESAAPPTLATPAAASPNPTRGTTAALSVLGADDGGESALTYTWSILERPVEGGATFSANGSNAAKNTVATFTRSGNYAFQVVIRDAVGQTVTSSVSITVSPTLTSVSVSPPTATVAPGGTQQFTATARDQFGVAIVGQPRFSWTISGGGTVAASGTAGEVGVFTAGSTPGGPFTLTAWTDDMSGSAQITISGGSSTATLNPVADAHVRDGANAAVNFGTAAKLEQKTSTVAGNHRRTFLRFSLSGLGSTVTQAKLRLYGASVTTAKQVGVYAVANVPWGETTITFNNAPAIGARQGTSRSVGLTAAYTEWDLTSYLQAQKAAGATSVSLEIKQEVANNETPTAFNSRENASNKPQLVVTSQ